MKRFKALFSLLFLGAIALQAQNAIAASEIISRLDAGNDVILSDMTITGDLNFTQVADKEEDRSGNWSNGNNYRCWVRNRVSFTNCRFTGKVIGYYKEQEEGNRRRNWNNNGPLYNADFYDAVSFSNCHFQDDVNFKYTRFHEGADFHGSRFDEGSYFKYTQFDENANLSELRIAGEAVFKYTKFPDGVTFAGTEFGGDANFKYTQFKEGVDMSNASFNREANFKYTQFAEGSNFNGTDFGNDAEFKYAQLDGRKFDGH